MIFETNRLLVRRLSLEDLDGFHEMQSNPKVMQYVDGEVKTYQEHKTELSDLIQKYDGIENDFWIYTIELKTTSAFIGTVALVKDRDGSDEIGYRFLERYWNHGYGFEVCEGLIEYCRDIGMERLIGYVTSQNIASKRILLKCGFQEIDHEDQENELKFELQL